MSSLFDYYFFVFIQLCVIFATNISITYRLTAWSRATNMIIADKRLIPIETHKNEVYVYAMVMEQLEEWIEHQKY